MDARPVERSTGRSCFPDHHREGGRRTGPGVLADGAGRRTFQGMAAKNRPDAARQAIAQQAATQRRGAPGRHFVGDAAEQRSEAKAVERRKVGRMIEVDHARHEAERIEVPVSAILAEIVQDALKLARTLVAAPFRIALALATRRVRAASG
jgi:hypothetical protein